MSSPVRTRTLAAPSPWVVTKRKSFSKFPRGIIISLLVTVALISIVALLWNKFWPFTEKEVVQDLAEASDSTVIIQRSHRTYFPIPGCILEGVEFRHGPEKWRLITIDKLTVEGSYPGILTRHVPRIRAEGGHVFVPPFGSNPIFQTKHSKLVVDRIVADGSIVEFVSNDPHKKPLRFEVHQGVLHDVRWDRPIGYELKFHNPEPPGEVETRGKFGVWTKGRPGETPISGEYSFDHADLGVYRGIAGILASEGKYEGFLKHIDVAGTTDVPDFEVRSGGHKVHLRTQFNGFVDAIHGDTFLKRVDARFGHTNLIVMGSVAKKEGHKKKVALLDLTSRQGRIEDILSLFVKEDRAPMSGPTSFKAKVEIPSVAHFLEKVNLQGAFGIDEGTFSKPETQKGVNELSAGARGEKMEDPETVVADLKGQVVLEAGVATFSDLSFGIPGADANMYGTYNILNHKSDLHGRMRVDTKISKTATGMKSLLLKAIDPFFKKKKKGEVVPVHITGTYEHPQFGLDLTKPKPQAQDK